MTNTAGPVRSDFPASTAPRRLPRALINCVLFLLACAAGCAAVGKVAPFPEVPGIFPKWAYFKERRDQFDVLFIGSSRFYHQIIPAQFDAAVGDVRSFNFGYDGMWPPESLYLLRQILALRPARLKWVVIDLMDINFRLDERNASTMRTAYWHDWRHTALTIRDILESRYHPPQKFELIMEHGRLGFQHLLNLGTGADALNRVLAPEPPRKKPYSWTPFAGFEAGPPKGMEGEARAGFEKTVERLKKGIAPAPVRPVFRDALAEIVADVRAVGAEPIFVIAPTINGAENFTDVPGGVTVLAFNDPARYPQLYDPAVHYDPWHLNETGAITFTRLLAEHFIERRKAR